MTDASIYQRMSAIQAALPAIGKTEWNEQQRKGGPTWGWPSAEEPLWGRAS